MEKSIEKVAVLGAGTMGAQIAGHLANAGIPSLLFDMDKELAKKGKKTLTSLKPAPLYKADNIDVDYTLSAFMKINDYLSTTLIIQCLYDDNAIKRVQLREVFGLAFIMDITEIPKII